jgi:hypothetical protein
MSDRIFKEPCIKSGSLNIPLSQIPQTQAFRNKVISKVHLAANQHSPSKPGRRLGAPWLDKYIVARMGVNLCDNCARRYGPGLATPKNGYRVDTNPCGAKFGVCDGCSAGNDSNPVPLIPYYAMENYESDRIKFKPSPISYE